MKRLLLDLLRRTAVGSALICVGVPLLQGQVVPFAQATESRPVLSVTGDVSGLEPGRVGRLDLTVHNDGSAAAPVHKLVTAVLTSVSGCSLSVDAWTGASTVAAHGSSSMTVPVRVRGPRCGGANWQLSYTVS